LQKGFALPLGEARDGDFAIDILAETLTGERLIIENQLEMSDHGHLGQISTYAAGVGASIIVWVNATVTAARRHPAS